MLIFFLAYSWTHSKLKMPSTKKKLFFSPQLSLKRLKTHKTTDAPYFKKPQRPSQKQYSRAPSGYCAVTFAVMDCRDYETTRETGSPSRHQLVTRENSNPSGYLEGHHFKFRTGPVGSDNSHSSDTTGLIVIPSQEALS